MGNGNTAHISGFCAEEVMTAFIRNKHEKYAYDDCFLQGKDEWNLLQSTNDRRLW